MRLIDADVALKNVPDLKSNGHENCGICILWDHYEMQEFIKEQPTVGIEPVRHGRWEMSSDIPDCIICDRCCAAFDVWKADIERYHYCPNCGAKMDLKED